MTAIMRVLQPWIDGGQHPRIHQLWGIVYFLLWNSGVLAFHWSLGAAMKGLPLANSASGSGPTPRLERPHKHKDPANQCFKNPRFIRPGNQNTGSLCLCGLLGPER